MGTSKYRKIVSGMDICEDLFDEFDKSFWEQDQSTDEETRKAAVLFAKNVKKHIDKLTNGLQKLEKAIQE